MNRLIKMTALLALCGLLTGCTISFSERAVNGVTFYCPGAGNVDMGDSGIRKGLEAAGYSGDVARVTWTVSFNPAIDQTVRINAKLGASRLARAIEEYIDEHPNREVNIIGLSAGTGVAVWALEDLKPGYKVDDVVLLASSLHYKYDLREAVRRVDGKIYNYYSPKDAVLSGPMKVFGTIDGKFLEQGAGEVGFHPPPGTEGKVANIRWRPEFSNYGYHGGHTDGTSPEFVRHYIAPQIMDRGSYAWPGPNGTMQMARVGRDARRR